MLESNKISIKEDNTVLEAEICWKKADNPKKIVLICHPHPQFLLSFSEKGKIWGKHV